MADRREDPVLTAFGGVVRRRRKARGESQERLAEAIGIHHTYVGGIERGERNVGLRNIAKIAIALDASLGDLFGEVDNELRKEGST